MEDLGTTDTMEKEKLSLGRKRDMDMDIRGAMAQAAFIIAMEKEKPEQLLFPSQEMFILVSN